MSDKPDFTKLPADQAFRLTCADHLRMIAGLVEKGAVTAFDLAWSEEFPKATGKLLTNALAFVGPVEAEMISQVQKERERIQVEDLTEALKKHEACPIDKQANCTLCSIKLS